MITPLPNGAYPEGWHRQYDGSIGYDSHWAYDQTQNKIIGRGGHALWKRTWHKLDNEDNQLFGFQDGESYKVKYTIEPPDDGNMLGEVTVTLHDNDTTAAPSGNFWTFGAHSSPGVFEHEIKWDTQDGGVVPGPQGPGTAWTHSAYKN